jgi:hypothetical protein
MSQQSGNSSPLLESVWRFWNSFNIVSLGMSYIGNICTTIHHWSFGCNSEVCQFASRVLSCLVSSCHVLSLLVLSYLPILHELCKGNILFMPVNWQINHRPALINTLVQILNIWGHEAYFYMWFTCMIGIHYTKSPLYNTKWSKMQFLFCLSFSLWMCRSKKEQDSASS